MSSARLSFLVDDSRLLDEFFALGEELARVAFAARTDGLGPQDLAVLADEHGRAVGDALVVEVDTVALRHRTLGVEVGEQREGDPAKGVGPVLVTELAIDRNTQDLGVCRLELRQERVQAGDFDASRRREVEGIENEQHGLRPSKVGGLHFAFEIVAIQLECGSVCSGLNDRHSELVRDEKR